MKGIGAASESHASNHTERTTRNDKSVVGTLLATYTRVKARVKPCCVLHRKRQEDNELNAGSGHSCSEIRTRYSAFRVTWSCSQKARSACHARRSRQLLQRKRQRHSSNVVLLYYAHNGAVSCLQCDVEMLTISSSYSLKWP